MKNDKKNKGFSPMKKVISAAGMLAVSASMLATSTYAWFSMNTQVTATGMSVKAKAEGGIVISTDNSSNATWASTANAINASATLFPTSTPTVITPTWVHAKSDNPDSAASGQPIGGYTDLTLAWSGANNTGIGYIDSDGTAGFTANDQSYVLANKFFIKSSGDSITGDLYINDLAVVSTQSNTAHDLQVLDNALRVLIVVNGTDAFTFAPVYNQASGTTTTSYQWKATTAVKARYTGGTGDFANQDLKCNSVTTISNLDASAIPVMVYMYYEGEDANLKSKNISGITMNDLALTINFGTEATHTG